MQHHFKIMPYSLLVNYDYYAFYLQMLDKYILKVCENQKLSLFFKFKSVVLIFILFIYFSKKFPSKFYS